MINRAFTAALAVALIVAAGDSCSAQTPACNGAPLMASSGVVINQNAAASIHSDFAHMAYLSGIIVNSGGSTVGSAVVMTITGLAMGTHSISFTSPLGAAVPRDASWRFDPPQPASGLNVPITVFLPALGAGDVGTSLIVMGCML